jgi:hypothetical protein
VNLLADLIGIIEYPVTLGLSYTSEQATKSTVKTAKSLKHMDGRKSHRGELQSIQRY